MNNRDDEEQSGFDYRKDSQSETGFSNAPPEAPEADEIDEFVEEAYSANYPEDPEDFRLEGDLEEPASDRRDWPEEESNSGDVELIWGDEEASASASARTP